MSALAHGIDTRPLLGAAAWTIAAAVAGVLAVREVAVRTLHPDPAFTPLSLGSPIIGTIVCTVMAIYVFVGMVDYPNPIRTWRRVSAGVLMLSFLPCVFISDLTHHGRKLARGLRAYGDACRCLGGLRNAPAMAGDHEAPSQDPGIRAFPLDSVEFEAAILLPVSRRPNALANYRWVFSPCGRR